MTSSSTHQIMKRRFFIATTIAAFAIAGCTPAPPYYDTVIRNGTIYDGLGGEPFAGDVAISGDRIAAVGDLARAVATNESDASG